MSKKSVTNIGPGARVINTVTGWTGEGEGKQPVIQMVHLVPGETKDVELLHHDDDHEKLQAINPVLHGMIKAGDLHVGAPGSKPPTAAEQADQAAAAVEAARKEGFEAGHKAGFAEGHAKGTEDAKPKR